MDYTEEQNKVIKSQDKVILVKAFAGTGKTTVLKGYAKARPETKFLYLAFNSAIVKEAEGKFPDNVTVSTMHSLAYKKIGYLYKKKLKGNLTKFDIMNCFELSYRNSLNVFMANSIYEIITNFCYSSYTSIEDAVPLNWNFSLISKESIVNMCKIYWSEMKDEKKAVPMTHDAYLKLFHLECNELPYETILFDEAQDANPVILDILQNQVSFGKNMVIVGDENQAIYRFRNSVNAMGAFSIENQYNLTGSFRFGENIANVVTKSLNIFKKQNIKINGLGNSGELLSVDDFKLLKDSKTFITRTNSGALDLIIDALMYKKKFNIVGGIKSYNVEKIIAVDNLMHNRTVKDPEIKKFKNYSEFIHFTESSEDQEMKWLRKIVEKYDKKYSIVDKHKRTIVSLETQIKRIEDEMVSESNAEIIITNTHKAKGKEFDNVALHNDFFDPFDNEGNIRVNKLQSKEEDLNLIYIALSRAKKTLRISKLVFNIMKTK